jgi:hypothetical protein
VNPSQQHFSAAIYRIWIMRYVDVPEEIASSLAREYMQAKGSGRRRATAVKKTPHTKRPLPKHIPVVVTTHGQTARATPVPAGGGHYRLRLNAALRKEARADAGDTIKVELTLDLASRNLPAPPDLREPLRQHPKARKVFEALGPSHRMHFILWFESAKSPEARERRLTKAIDILLERALLYPPRLARGQHSS